MFRTCEQRNDLALGEVRSPSCGPPEVMNRGLGSVEKLRLGGYSSREWTDNFLPGLIEIAGSDLTLPRKNLPQSHIGLKNAQSVGSQSYVRSTVNRVHDSEKTGDGSVIQSFEFGKNEVLVAVARKLFAH